MLYKEQGITVLGVCVCYDLFVASSVDVWGFCATLKLAAKMLMTTADNDAPKKR